MTTTFLMKFGAKCHQERDKQTIVACHAEVPRDLSQFLPPLPLSRAPPAFIINLSRKRFFSSFFPFYDTNFELAAIFVCQPASQGLNVNQPFHAPGD